MEIVIENASLFWGVATRPSEISLPSVRFSLRSCPGQAAAAA